MEIYTLKEASRKTKIGVETLRRACEEGLVKATRLAGNQWRIAETALEEALHRGIDLRGTTKRSGKKQSRRSQQWASQQLLRELDRGKQPRSRQLLRR